MAFGIGGIGPATQWKFEQLSAAPGQAKKSITLEGSSAPHGRPRQGPVVSDGQELRKTRVYYPGNDVPTNHIFGSKEDDLSLHGRWRDTTLGKDGAAELVQQFQDMLRDARPIRVTWGSIISIVGFLDKFTPGRESPSDITWQMTICVDSPDNARVTKVDFPDKAQLSIQTMLKELGSIENGVAFARRAAAASTDFLDSLDELISSINTFSASIVHLVNEVEVFEKGVASELNRLRGGIHQMRTAVLTLRNVAFTTAQDTTRLVETADTDINWFTVSRNTDVGTQRVLAILNDLDREAELRIRSQQISSYTAKLGDSWERISIQFFGGPEFAGKIRQANGIKYGEQPISGRTYIIPQN